MLNSIGQVLGGGIIHPFGENPERSVITELVDNDSLDQAPAGTTWRGTGQGHGCPGSGFGQGGTLEYSFQSLEVRMETWGWGGKGLFIYNMKQNVRVSVDDLMAGRGEGGLGGQGESKQGQPRSRGRE